MENTISNSPFSYRRTSTNEANYLVADKSSTAQSAVSETDTAIFAKENEMTDYHLVIKQFDDLIYELFDSGNTNKKCTDKKKESTSGVKDIDCDKLNARDKNAEDSSSHNKSLFCNQSNRVKNKIIEGKKIDSSTNSIGLNDKMHILKEKQSLSESKNLDENFSGYKESMPWNYSHLWSNESKRESAQFQKPDLKTRKNMSMDVLTGNSRENNLDLSQSMTNVSQNCDLLISSCYSKQIHKKNSTYKNYSKYDSRTYAEIPFIGKSMYNSKLECQANKTYVTTSLLKSPMVSKSPASRYVLPGNCYMVKLYIETRDLHLGPFSFEIYPKMTLRLLKLKVEQEHGIIPSCQKWILCKHFAVDDDKSLADYNVLPGSSIIVYVDNKQKVVDKATENKYIKERKCARTNEKSTKHWKSISFENLSKVQKSAVEARELVRKDSLDSKLADSCQKADFIKRDFFGSDTDSINTSNSEQSVIFKSRKVGSSSSKKKIPKKGIEPKKKTKVVIHKKYDSHNNGDSVLKMENANNFEKHNFVSNEILDCRTGINTSHLVKIEPICGNVHGQSHSQLNDPQNTFTDFDIFTQLNKLSLSNSYLKSQKIAISEDLPSCSNILPPINAEELIIDDLSIINTRTENDSSYLNDKNGDEYLLKEYGNLKQSQIDFPATKEIKSQVLKDSKTPILLDVLDVQKTENMEMLCTSENDVYNTKKSISSFIRKLSLARKEKSVDDASYQMDTPSKEKNDEAVDKDTYKLTSSNANQLLLNDVHIEILSKDPNTFSFENNMEPHISKNIQADVITHGLESVKNFELLLEIENMDLVENTTSFICPVCFDEFESGKGVILHDCLHTFCRNCLSNSIYYADSALVKCPYRDDFYSCQSHLQQREIKALVSEDLYEKYLQRSIITAEGLAEKSFHCKTPDCRGWCIYDNAINVFHCPVCFHYNCLNCQAIHEGLNCRQYQDKLKLQQKIDKESEKTLELLNKMIESGKALQCPKCELILLKKWGCDWLKCSVCKTEICWVTRGPRWGPGGQGDTSGGCKCGVNGVKCHPSCTYCH